MITSLLGLSKKELTVKMALLPNGDRIVPAFNYKSVFGFLIPSDKKWTVVYLAVFDNKDLDTAIDLLETDCYNDDKHIEFHVEGNEDLQEYLFNRGYFRNEEGYLMNSFE